LREHIRIFGQPFVQRVAPGHHLPEGRMSINRRRKK
jgi:hypothetical protein